MVYTGFLAPTNFNGSCFGMRYYVGFAPVLAWYAVRGWERWRGRPRFRRVFYALGLISLAFALTGMQQPWLLMENNPHPFVRGVVMLLGGPPH